MRKVKGTWEFSDSDTFDLDHVLSPVILAGLRKFRNLLAERHAKNEVIAIPVAVVDHLGDVGDADVNRWLEILDLMIYAFDESNEPDILAYDLDAESPYAEYRAASNAYHQKRMRGLKLFAEYFNDLWW